MFRKPMLLKKHCVLVCKEVGKGNLEYD